MDNRIPDALLPAVHAALRQACPRLTADDLAQAEGRQDLLAARVQFRQWCSRVEARRMVFKALREAGAEVTA